MVSVMAPGFVGAFAAMNQYGVGMGVGTLKERSGKSKKFNYL